MTYTNQTYYIDYENGVDAVRTALTTVAVSDNAGTIRCTKTAHGQATGAILAATGFNVTELTGSWRITVIDANIFDLDGSVWVAGLTGDTGTFTPNGGVTKADAWKTLDLGATAARVQGGDTCRIMASPDPTLVGDCLWTQYSRNITLPTAVTVPISDCELVWTGSANTTASVVTTLAKENLRNMQLAIVAGFTTGKLAYFATGTLDLSGYQQVSLWFRTNLALVAGAVSLRLCTDTIGDVAAHTFALPAIPASSYIALTFNNAAALNAAIASVSFIANSDPGAATLSWDSIIACKAAASPDSLTLNSLIGKAHNISWAAATTYAVDNVRRPTPGNRNGFAYKVTAQVGASGATEPAWPEEYGLTVVDGGVTWTCFSLEETWCPIASISGTTVRLDNNTNVVGATVRGYVGATETVATYKRETFKHTLLAAGQSLFLPPKGGSPADGVLVFSGGWDRTNMAVQSGETWWEGRGSLGIGMSFGLTGVYTELQNVGFARYDRAFGNGMQTLRNVHAVGMTTSGLYGGDTTNPYAARCIGGSFCYGAGSGAIGGSALINLQRVSFNSNISSGFNSLTLHNTSLLTMDYIDAINNGSFGIWHQSEYPLTISELTTANNTSVALTTNAGPIYLRRCTINESPEFGSTTAGKNSVIYSQDHDRVIGAHKITTPDGLVSSDATVRHTASGFSWKFVPGSARRTLLDFPLTLSLGKIAVTAATPVSLRIWAYHDGVFTEGQLSVKGGQVRGVPNDLTVDCTPSALSTWEQSGILTFTPSEDGVVEVTFQVGATGISVTGSFWIDDLLVS